MVGKGKVGIFRKNRRTKKVVNAREKNRVTPRQRNTEKLTLRAIVTGALKNDTACLPASIPKRRGAMHRRKDRCETWEALERP